MIEDPDEVKTILDNLGLLYFDRGVPGFMGPRAHYTNQSMTLKKDEDDEENPYRPLRVIQDDIFRILRRKIVQKKNG